VYSTNGTFVSQMLHELNYTGVSLAMNSNLPDPSNATTTTMTSPSPSSSSSSSLLSSASASSGAFNNVNLNSNSSLLKSYNVGRAENVLGQKITAPWMRAWSVLPFYGCINNPDYRAIAFNMATQLVRAGIRFCKR